MDFDLDKVMAEREAAAPPPFTFKFDGNTYTMPRTPDVRAIMKIEIDNDLHGGFAQLMGADQWEQLKASPKLLSTAALVQLYTEYVTYASGVRPQKAPALRAVKGTGPRSKATTRAEA